MEMRCTPLPNKKTAMKCISVCVRVVVVDSELIFLLECVCVCVVVIVNILDILLMFSPEVKGDVAHNNKNTA